MTDATLASCLRDLIPLLPTWLSRDDALQVGRLAAWQADQTFTPGRGSRSGYVWQQVQWAVIDLIRAVNGRSGSRRRAASAVSLDAAIFEADGGPLTIADTVVDGTAGDFPDAVGDQMEARELVARLTPRQRRIAELKAAGLANRQVGAQLGISSARVAQLLDKVRRDHGWILTA